MSARPRPAGPAEDAAQVKAFFDQWAIYRKVVDLDYLSHRGACAAIGAELRGIGAPFSFLDLGAGDAEGTVRALAGTPVSFYQAVDLSSVALELAARRAGELDCEKRFVPGDFVACVESMTESFDVVFIGLSLHHLPTAHKRSFLPELRRILRPGGRLMFYEPILLPGETRDGVMRRWWRFAQTHWRGLTDAELAEVKRHIFENDYPESVADFQSLLAEAGFHRSSVPFRSADDFYAVFVAHA